MTRARSLSLLANSNIFTVDQSNSRVGIGSTIPDVKLDVNGNMNVSGTLTYEDVTNVNTAGITTTGGLVVTGLGATIGGITTFFGDLNFGAAGVGGTVTTLGHAEFAGIVTATSFSGGGVGIADSIFHIEDSNTAIRFPAADTFTVETAGSEAIRVDSSGNVGIGTASPQAKLDVKGRINVTNISNESNYGEIYDGGGLVIKSHNSNPMYFYTGGTEKVRIDSSGNVGIGTDNPSRRLQVQANGSTPSALFGNSEHNNSIEVTRTGSTGSYFQVQTYTNICNIVGGPAFSIRTSDLVGSASTERLRVNSSGLVGIGTDDPQQDVQIDSSTETTLALYEDGRKFGALQAQGNFGTILYSYNGNPLVFSTNSGTGFDRALTIDTSQRLLVGSTSARANFNNGSRTAYLQLEGASDPNIDSSSIALIYNQNSTGNASNIYFGKTRGGSIGANTALNATDDRLGNISFQGNDGTQFVDAAHIRAFTDGTPGTDDMPARLVFSTNSGTTSPTERLRITSDGKVRVPDSGRFTCGTDDDLALRHSGNTGVLENSTGHFYVDQNTDDYDIYLRTDDGSGGLANYVQCDGSVGSVILSHYGTTKLTTVADGVDFSGTGSIKVPVGTTAQRNASPTAGDFRYNSTTGDFEGYTDEWGAIAGGGGITTQVGNASGIVTSMFLTDATDHKVTATGICTITTTQAGTEGESHTIRIVNSGIATVGFSTYFLFPSGSSPVLPTTSGAVSLISFTVHDSVGAGCTQLLAGASVNFS